MWLLPRHGNSTREKFSYWLVSNVVVDGIVAAYLNTIPYSTIFLTFLFFSLCAVFGMNRKKFNRFGTGLLAILIAGFLYVLSLNLFTPLSVPYWVLFYPVIFGIIAYADQKYKLEGWKKFFVHFGGYALVIVGIVLYGIQFPPA